MSRSGAELLVEALVAAGTKYLFSVSGNQILSIYDATIGRDIEIVHTRHEAAAVHMADGWGRLTEVPGVALVTAGPGHCNALSALYTAGMAESPLLLLSGHCPLAQIGKGAFQEMDQVALAAPLTKASWLARDSASLGADVAAALALSGAGRPGPVHLSLPSDVLEAAVETEAPPAPTAASSAPPDAGLVDEILDLLAGARRPMILCGPAMARGRRWCGARRLSQSTGIPLLPMESPRGTDDPWLHAATDCLRTADLVLLAGKKLDFTLRFGQSPFSETCRFIQIDADQEELRPNALAVLQQCADPSTLVGQLAAAATQRRWQHRAWRLQVETARQTVPRAWKRIARCNDVPIHPLRLCAALEPFLADGAILVSDGGEFGQWVQAGLDAPGRRLINGPAGSIGSSFSLGLAAKMAHPQRQVFIFMGDGTFGFHPLEFDTARRYDLPVVVIVGNDARWNAEWQLQLVNYGTARLVGCDLLHSHYEKTAEAAGGYGEFVRHPEDLTAAVERAVASGLPACVNVIIDSVPAPTVGTPADHQSQPAPGHRRRFCRPIN